MSTYQLLIDGSPVPADFYDSISALQVEESSDLPDALRIAPRPLSEGGCALVK